MFNITEVFSNCENKTEDSCDALEVGLTLDVGASVEDDPTLRV